MPPVRSNNAPGPCLRIEIAFTNGLPWEELSEYYYTVDGTSEGAKCDLYFIPRVFERLLRDTDLAEIGHLFDMTALLTRTIVRLM